MLGTLVDPHSSKLSVHLKCLACVVDIFLPRKLIQKILLTWLKDIKRIKDALKDNPCLLNFMSAKRQTLTFAKFEMASLTAWWLKSQNNNVAKTGSFPFPRGPDPRFWKLRIISLSPKRLWISVTCNFSLVLFDSKIKMNFEE